MEQNLLQKNFKGITSSKYMNLLDVINIPGGNKIVIAKINKKIYILSTSNSNTNVIDIIDEGEFYADNEDFDNYLNKHLNKNNINHKLEDKIKELFNKSYINKDKEDKHDEKKH